MSYGPEQYLVSIEEPKVPCWNQIKGYITEVTVDSTKGATVPAQIGKSQCNALVDIGATKSIISEKYVPYEWTPECTKTFETLKNLLVQEPILKYPDPGKPYILYTDASKYAWSCVLTQEYNYEIEGKIKQIYHPITYASGLFKGSQINWATSTKEAYAIYMSVKKFDYYLQDAEITLRSDHLPLRKFLEKKTLNAKVNNWAVEISPYKIKFEYIKGVKKILWLIQ